MSTSIKPLVTVITVVYNSFNNIEETIKSVIEQSYKNIEFIIIDGGSTDGTKDIISKYSSFISCFISENDNGIYDAMNKGIINSNGEWLIFLNSGDLFYDKEVINKIFSHNSNLKFDILYGNTKVKNIEKVINAKEIFSHYFFYNNTFCHQSIFFNINTFNINGFFNIQYKIISDRDWLIRAFLIKMKFKYINQIISIWEKDGFSSNNINIFKKEELIFRNFYFNKAHQLFLKIWCKFLFFFNKFKHGT